MGGAGRTEAGRATGGAGEWAMLETPLDSQIGLVTLRQFLDDAGK